MKQSASLEHFHGKPGLRLRIPKGVYRFNSFDEADAWLEKHIREAELEGSAHLRAAQPKVLRGWLKRAFGRSD